MTHQQSISLTPGFSRVSNAVRIQKPFQRFLPRGLKTVETVSTEHLVPNTWLKPGVNESTVSMSEGTLSGKMSTIKFIL
jgi:hypothetical protein